MTEKTKEKIMSIIKKFCSNHFVCDEYLVTFNDGVYTISGMNISYTVCVHVKFKAEIIPDIPNPSIVFRNDLRKGEETFSDLCFVSDYYKGEFFRLNYPYRSEFLNDRGYVETFPPRFNAFLQKQVINDTPYSLFRVLGNEAVISSSLLRTCFYTVPDKLFLKLLGEDNPLCIRYNVDDLTCYGVIAPILIEHECGVYEVKE